MISLEDRQALTRDIDVAHSTGASQTDHIGLAKVDHQQHIFAKSQSLPTPFFQ